MPSCMRTTVRIDDDLLRAAKRLAMETDRTFTAVIEDALRLVISMSKKSSKPSGVVLKTVSGRGLLPGIPESTSTTLRICSLR